MCVIIGTQNTVVFGNAVMLEINAVPSSFF